MSAAVPLAKRVVVGFGAGSLGAALSFGVVPLLFLFYLTEAAQVPPAIAGLMLAAPKVADILFDPWIGRHCDALARRIGGRPSLIAVSAFALPAVLVLLFVPMPGLTVAARVTLLAILLVAQSLLSTMFTVAHTAVAGDLSEDIVGRAKLMSSRAIGQTVAGVLVSMAAPQLVARLGDAHGGYLGMAGILGLGAMASLGVCWIAVRRVPMRAGIESEVAQPLFSAVRKTFKNRRFYGIALILVLLGASSSALFNVLPYVNKDLFHAGAENMSFLLGPLFVALFAGVAIAPWLARRARPESALTGALGIALAAIVSLLIVPRGAGPAAAALVAFGLASGVLTVLVSTLSIEASTKSSEQGESLGLYLGLLFSAEKLGQSLGGIVIGLGLDWVRVQDSTTLDAGRLEALWVGAPAAGLVIATLVARRLSSRRRAESA